MAYCSIFWYCYRKASASAAERKEIVASAAKQIESQQPAEKRQSVGAPATAADVAGNMGEVAEVSSTQQGCEVTKGTEVGTKLGAMMPRERQDMRAAKKLDVTGVSGGAMQLHEMQHDSLRLKQERAAQRLGAKDIQHYREEFYDVPTVRYDCAGKSILPGVYF